VSKARRETFPGGQPLPVGGRERSASVERLRGDDRETFSAALPLPVGNEETFHDGRRLPVASPEAFHDGRRLPVRGPEAFPGGKRLPAGDLKTFQGGRGFLADDQGSFRVVGPLLAVVGETFSAVRALSGERAQSGTCSRSLRAVGGRRPGRR
jgi:hypothetical protein